MKRVISCLVLYVVLEKLVSGDSNGRTMIVKIFHESIFFFFYMYIVAFVELDSLMKFQNFFTQIDHYLNLEKDDAMHYLNLEKHNRK